MTYDSEVAADSPWGYWKTDEASGNLLDSSGNSRTLTLPGGAPTYAQTGPGGGSDAQLSPDSSGGTEYYAISSASLGGTTSALTLECWFYLTANPTNRTPLVGFGYGFGNTSLRPAFLWLDTDGTIHLWWGSSSSSFITIGSASAVSLNTWHHVVAPLTSTEGKIRLDKADVASGSHATAIASSGQFMLRGGHNGTSQPSIGDHRDGSVVTIAKPAAYLSTLTDTRIDAHYDAMVGGGGVTGTLAATLAGATLAASGTETFSGTLAATTGDATLAASGTVANPVTGTFAATLPVPTTSFTGTYAAPPTGSLAATLTVPTVDLTGTYAPPPNPTGSFAATLPVPAVDFTGGYTPPAQTGTFAATLPVPSPDFTGTYTPAPITGTFGASLPVPVVDFAGLSGDIFGSFAVTLPPPVVALSGSYGGPYPTDTSNLFDGLDMVCVGIVTKTAPAVTPPTNVGVKQDKALAYPLPVMVNGRPT
jgi:hypothetical protein